MHPASLVDPPRVSSCSGGGHTTPCIRMAPRRGSSRRESAGVAGTGRLAGVALAEHRGTPLLVGSDARLGRSVPLAESARRRQGCCGTHTQRRGAVRARRVGRGWRRRARDDKGGGRRESIYTLSAHCRTSAHSVLCPPPQCRVDGRGPPACSLRRHRRPSSVHTPAPWAVPRPRQRGA